MKKTLALSLLSFVISFSLSAQIKKGSTLLGVDLAYNTYTSKQESTGNESTISSNDFSSSLLLGKAVKENLFVGGGLSFSTSTSKTVFPEATEKNKTYGVSVWTRKYFPVFGPLYAFVNGSVYGNFGNSERSDNNDLKIKNMGFGVGIYPGISVQLKKSFYLDASLNNLANISYIQTKREQPDGLGGTSKQTISNFGVSTSLGNSSNPLQLGIRWIIPGKG
ncbi:MAG: hypothetical protein V4685_14735 [Bacteroidota bacterium]